MEERELFVLCVCSDNEVQRGNFKRQHDKGKAGFTRNAEGSWRQISYTKVTSVL